MKILTVSSCDLDPMLGSGKTRLRWTEGLRALGHSVDVLEPGDFELWRGARRALRFRQALGAASVVPERLRLQDYDLVEFFGGEFGLATERLARRSQRPLIVAHTDGFELLASERESEYDSPRTAPGRLRRWIQHQTHDRLSRAAFVHADAFVTGCELDRKRVIEMNMFGREQTAVVSPGLDSEYLSIAPSPARDRRIAFTGTWIPRKGTGHVVEAMNEVLRERPGLQFDLYGTGGGETVLRQFSESVRARISVHGRLTNQQIAEGLSRAAIFFFPSQYEGFGMALAEAMACGCAPVTTPTGFGAELRNGDEAVVCGFNDVPAMRRAILALLDDEGLRSRIANAARARVSLLSWDAQIGRLEAAYLSWLGARTLDVRRRANA